MNRNRFVSGWLAVAALVVSLCFPALASGQGTETAGVITALKMGRGRVEVRGAGTHEWRVAGPLRRLRAGDQVRATEDASVVILLTGGRGDVTVVAASSPFVVPAPRPGETKIQKGMTILAGILEYLFNTAKEVVQAPLSTRDGPKPPVILSPRDGPVLPDSLTFEWLEGPFSIYTIRIVGPKGVVLERTNLTRPKFEYPVDAPPLMAGVRYTLQVLSGTYPVQQAWFEVLDASRAQAIREDLKELERAVGPTVSPNTLVALRAAFLASNGLFHDARLLLVGALAKDLDEPTFHLLLGSVYGKVGLPELAAESYNEASFLLSGSARP